MKKFYLQTFLVMNALFFIFNAGAIVKKPWTFLVYLAAANDLNKFALLDLQEMMQVGSSSIINVLVYLTIHEEGESKQTKKLYINKGSMTQIGDTMIRDSGHMTTLVEALQWAHVDFPSDNIAVVLWDHGSGPLNRSEKALFSKGVCYDFDTGNYLTDRDCLQAFTWIKDNLRGGKNFNIIAFDACLLASIEMAYTLSWCADYMVASQEIIPSDGYQYAYILNQCVIKSLDPLSFAKLMVRAYNQEYLGNSNYTLSAVDLNASKLLVENCNAVAQILTSQLKGKNSVIVKSTLKKCINAVNCPSFDKGIYVDMYQFYKNLLKNIDGLKLSASIVAQFQQLLNNGIKMFITVVQANVTSKNYKLAGGLSIYLPRYTIDPSYYGLYWTEKNPNWLNFLEAYIV